MTFMYYLENIISTNWGKYEEFCIILIITWKSPQRIFFCQTNFCFEISQCINTGSKIQLILETFKYGRTFKAIIAVSLRCERPTAISDLNVRAYLKFSSSSCLLISCVNALYNFKTEVGLAKLILHSDNSLNLLI